MGGCKFDSINLEALGMCWGHSAVKTCRDDDGDTRSTHHSRSMTVMEGPAPKLLLLPYIDGVTERIECVCHPLGIRVSCGYRGNMRVASVKVKQPTPELDKKGVVYEVPCGECNHVYNGETGRTLRKRRTEHKAAVKKYDNKNGIAVHAWKSGHQVDWESAKVKNVVPNLAHRRITEALHTHQKPNTTNLDLGRHDLSLPPHMTSPPHLFPSFAQLMKVDLRIEISCTE